VVISFLKLAGSWAMLVEERKAQALGALDELQPGNGLGG
jgi:hypothetical protein